MPRPLRSELFLPHEVSICHVVQRCVRRMYLAGLDDETVKISPIDANGIVSDLRNSPLSLPSMC